MADWELLNQASAWIADDPDIRDRAELQELLGRARTSRQAQAELADRFSGRLQFGTAGLRGPLRAGPNGMNRAVVRAAAAGLVAYLAAENVAGPLVIGYDARYRSHEFALETAAVAIGVGRDALVLPRALPTPVLAYAIRALGACAGIMVTASHNPAQDNGYKVYLADGAQIAPPVDAEIARHIGAVGSLLAVPLGDISMLSPGELPPLGAALDVSGGSSSQHANAQGVATLVDESLIRDYVAKVAQLVHSKTPRDIQVVYTPMHGVGGAILPQAFTTAGFPAPHVVTQQAKPDPDFPTVAFPNPEEPGALNLLLELASSERADIAIANDPDADRCAVALNTTHTSHQQEDRPKEPQWRVLSGDELGILLADHLMRRGKQETFVTTIVSSSMLQALCRARGMSYIETLTGFKWIMRATPSADDIAFGYEEALGYAVAPDLVRDKDGISAALLITELASQLKHQGQTLADRLEELSNELGTHLTSQISVRFADLGEIDALMSKLRATPPATLLDQHATCEDLLPRTDALILRADGLRVVIRPSGTEPKLKAYLEVQGPATQHAALAEHIAALIKANE